MSGLIKVVALKEGLRKAAPKEGVETTLKESLEKAVPKRVLEEDSPTEESKVNGPRRTTKPK